MSHVPRYSLQDSPHIKSNPNGLSPDGLTHDTGVSPGLKSPRTRRKPPPDWNLDSPLQNSPSFQQKSPTSSFQSHPQNPSLTPGGAVNETFSGDQDSEFQFQSMSPSPGGVTPSDTNVTKTNKFENDFNEIIHNIESEIDQFNIDSSSSVYNMDSPAKMSKSSINDPFSLGADTPEPNHLLEQNPGYNSPIFADSATSLSSNQPIPYPLGSPIVPSPTESSYESPNNSNSPGISTAPGFPTNSGIASTPGFTESSDSVSRVSHRPPPSALNAYDRSSSQTTTNTLKSIPLKPTISTPITNLPNGSSTINSTNESLRQINTGSSSGTTNYNYHPHNSGDSSNNSTTNSLNNSFMANSSSGGHFMMNSSSSNSMNNLKFGHRKSSSISSILSNSSGKNVNLATLKKTLSLRPGEGERSNYVLTIRRNAGTAFNESGPGKWKLPTGIAPVDKRATYTSSNGKYMRFVGNIAQNKLKKASGVELKHGHLAPRLLAAEVDDNDDRSLKFRTSQAAATATGQRVPENNGSDNNGGANTPKNKSSNSSLLMTATPGAASINSTISSGKDSLSRTITENSVSSTSNGDSKDAASEISKPRSSSDSSGSLNEASVGIGGFYQHPGYKYDEEEDGDTTFQNGDYKGDNEIDNADETHMDQGSSFEEFRDQPKLVLANPDSDSE